MCIFLWKKSGIGIKWIFHECWRNFLKLTFCWKKVIVCLKGLKEPFKHTKTFSANCVLFVFQYLCKVHFIPIQDFFTKICRLFKKEKKMLTARSSNCSVSAKLSPMLVEMPYSGKVLRRCPRSRRKQGGSRQFWQCPNRSRFFLGIASLRKEFSAAKYAVTMQ